MHPAVNKQQDFNEILLNNVVMYQKMFAYYSFVSLKSILVKVGCHKLNISSPYQPY